MIAAPCDFTVRQEQGNDFSIAAEKVVGTTLQRHCKTINLGWVPSAAILQAALPAGSSTAGVQTQCSIHDIVLLDIHSIHIINLGSATKFHCIVVLHGVANRRIFTCYLCRQWM